MFSVSIRGVPRRSISHFLFHIFRRLTWKIFSDLFYKSKERFTIHFIIFFQYKGFPNKFTTRKDLITFLNRFIWVTVQHAACNYPLIPYGAYVPIAPTKLYYDPRKEAEINYAYNLPNATHTLVSLKMFI